MFRKHFHILYPPTHVASSVLDIPGSAFHRHSNIAIYQYIIISILQHINISMKPCLNAYYINISLYQYIKISISADSCGVERVGDPRLRLQLPSTDQISRYQYIIISIIKISIYHYITNQDINISFYQYLQILIRRPMRRRACWRLQTQPTSSIDKAL